MDGTLAEFKPVNQMETLYEQGYFRSLAPLPNVVNAVREILGHHKEIEVFILSAYLEDSPHALIEKNQWLDQHLPEITFSHRIFVPCGKSKKDYVPDYVKETDVLLDDYTHNLLLWQPFGRGVKLLNGINHTKGTWQNDCIHSRRPPNELVAAIVGIVQSKLEAKDTNTTLDLICGSEMEYARRLQVGMQRTLNSATSSIVEELNQHNRLKDIPNTLRSDRSFLAMLYNQLDAERDAFYAMEYASNPENENSANQKAALQSVERLNGYIDFVKQKILNRLQQYQLQQNQNTYSIFQLKNGPSNRSIRFISLHELASVGKFPNIQNYDLVYSGHLMPGVSLDDLYYKFNCEHPEDYYGRSLSISDVIVITGEDQAGAYYVDRLGFEPIQDFALLHKSACKEVYVVDEDELEL